MMRSMVIDMNDEQLHTLAQMQAFLDGTVAPGSAHRAAPAATRPTLSKSFPGTWTRS